MKTNGLENAMEVINSLKEGISVVEDNLDELKKAVKHLEDVLLEEDDECDDECDEDFECDGECDEEECHTYKVRQYNATDERVDEFECEADAVAFFERASKKRFEMYGNSPKPYGVCNLPTLLEVRDAEFNVVYGIELVID